MDREEFLTHIRYVRDDIKDVRDDVKGVQDRLDTLNDRTRTNERSIAVLQWAIGIVGACALAIFVAIITKVLQ